MKRLVQLVLILAAAAPARAVEFVDGTHVVNDQDVPVRIVYDHSCMTTAICDVREPTGSIRNGLVGALDREVTGFTVVSRAPDQYGVSVRVTADVAPHTAVSCLCVNGCAVEVQGVDTVDAPDGGTVMIRDGAATLGGQREAGDVQPPPLAIEFPEILGALDRSIFHRVFDRHTAALLACYEGSRSAADGKAGTILLRFKVSPSGDVSEVSLVENGLGDAPVAECLVACLPSVRFPQTKGGGIVWATMRLRFNP